ncbi:hypothetical protein BJY01DRAFT_229027 [Aspergillus pseudoustus]|uniref:Uncharacterized protein n=1 Tax=Aspergillus pseudoustus TaxID=1810923 RepID=A0ABR4IIP4_9EURO
MISPAAFSMIGRCPCKDSCILLLARSMNRPCIIMSPWRGSAVVTKPGGQSQLFKETTIPRRFDSWAVRSVRMPDAVPLCGGLNQLADLGSKGAQQIMARVMPTTAYERFLWTSACP